MWKLFELIGAGVDAASSVYEFVKRVVKGSPSQPVVDAQAQREGTAAGAAANAAGKQAGHR